MNSTLAIWRKGTRGIRIQVCFAFLLGLGLVLGLELGVPGGAWAGAQTPSLTFTLVPLNPRGILQLPQVLKHPLIQTQRLVFSPSDRAFLIQTGESTLAQSYSITLRPHAKIKVLQDWIRNQKLDVQLEDSKLNIRLNDLQPLESLQWGLHNSGAPQRTELSYLHTGDLPAVAGEDIDWNGFTETPDGRSPQRKIRVAILDTGIDLEHPNLKDHIARKPESCAILEKYKDCLKQKKKKAQCESEFANAESDPLGYPMDCTGWNFSAGENTATGVYGNYDTQDSHGHGTHVAGVIGAAANGTGIRGIIQNVELLPVKILSVGPNGPVKPQNVDQPGSDSTLPLEKTSDWQPGLVDHVARGVLYAIRSHADLISLSASWPAPADSQLMKKMTAFAQSQGILFVASAGNDSSDVRTRPCDYDGVICVGAHNPDGTLSYFSNFGSFVDLAAPGINILSTWPMTKAATGFTAYSGYELKDGTSMSTPFVTGVLARLLLAGYSPQEATARLLLGTRPLRPSGRKTVQTGNLDLKGSFQVTPQPLILPDGKKTLFIHTSGQAKEIPLAFTLKNYWQAGQKITLHAEIVSSLPNAGGHLSQSDWTIAAWESGESAKKTFQTHLIVDDPWIEGRLALEIQAQSEGAVPRSFRIPVDLSVPVTPEFSEVPGTLSFPIQGEALLERAQIRTVTPLDGREEMDYFLIRKSESGRTLQLIAQQGDHYEAKMPQDFSTLEGELLLVQRLNLNQDGIPFYALVYRVPPKKQGRLPGFRFELLSRDLQSQKISEYDSNETAITDGFQWLKASSKPGAPLIPVWLSVGVTPAIEKPPFDPWDPTPEDTPELRLYALNSQTSETNEVRSIPIPSEYGLVKLLLPSEKQRAQGTTSLLLSQGDDYHLKYFIGSLTGSEVTDIHPFALPQFRFLLNFDSPLEILSVLPRVSTYGTAFQGAAPGGGQKITWIYSPQSESETYRGEHTTYSSPSNLDAIVNVSGVFRGEQTQATFSQTYYQIHFQDHRTGESATTDLDRFTFLPDFLTQMTAFPIQIEQGIHQERLPGVIIPNGLGIANAMEVVIPNYDATSHRLLGLIRPAKFRLFPDSGCHSIGNLIQSNLRHATQKVYFCVNKFIRIPLSKN